MKLVQHNQPSQAISALRGLLIIGPNTLHAQAVAREMLRSFVQGLSIHGDWENDAEFRSFLVLASATLGLTQKELAYQLMVSQMTLQRWIKGEALPLRIARKGIIAALTELAYTMIDDIAKNVDPNCELPSSPVSTSDGPSDAAVGGLCEIGCVSLNEESA